MLKCGMTVIPALPYKFNEKGKDERLFVPIVAQAYHKSGKAAILLNYSLLLLTSQKSRSQII